MDVEMSSEPQYGKTIASFENVCGGKVQEAQMCALQSRKKKHNRFNNIAGQHLFVDKIPTFFFKYLVIL